MKSNFAKVIVLCMAMVFVALLFWTSRSAAIPAFARKHGTSCTTCHVVPPKLNSFGVAFKNNGYRIPGG